MLTRRQIYILLITIAAGMMLGRIIAVNRTDTILIERDRVAQIPRQLKEKAQRLHNAGVSEEDLRVEMERTEEQLRMNASFGLPVFSANDRSRWNTIRVLVEPDMRVERTVIQPDGTEHVETVWYAIDKAQNVRGWDTIDMVKHNNVAAEITFGDAVRQAGNEVIEKISDLVVKVFAALKTDETAENEVFVQPNAEERTEDIAANEPSGQIAPGYLYSSKPPLLPTLMAIPYALMYQVSDGKLSLAQEPYMVVRVTLILCNLLPLVLCWFLLSRLIERFGTTNWGRVFCVAFLCFGTFLTTFAVTLNNHIPGMVSVTIALYCAVRIIYDKEIRWRYFLFAGFFSAFAVACEKPALLFFGLLGLWLLGNQWRRTLLIFLPAALLVTIAFFATNYIAHKTLLPAYSQQEWYFYQYERGTNSAGQPRVLDSYWKNPQGLDKGEEDRRTYVFHSTVGHHGLFSLTPVLALSLLGLFIWLFDRRYWIMSAIFLLTSIVVFVFYMTLPLELRNYGGSTSALRWVFWLVPLWSLALVAAADWFSKNGFLRAIALACLMVSIMSAAYPVWNPWTMPWTYNLIEYMGK